MRLAATLVCFAASFAYESRPNISHAVMDGAVRTLCGRRDWMTNEGRLDEADGEHLDPDCLVCGRAVDRMRKAGAA